VVGPPFVGEEAVLAEVIAVAGHGPVTAERGLRLLVLVPVEGAARIPRHPEVARVARAKLAAVVVDDLRAIPRHGCAARAAARGARPVADEDVQHLGRADAVDDLGAEALLPAVEERLGQRLTRGHAEL